MTANNTAATPLPTATTTGSFRLSPSEIPSTWTKPAENVSTLPTPAQRPGLTGVLVVLGVLACVALAYGLAPRHPSTNTGVAIVGSTTTTTVLPSAPAAPAAVAAPVAAAAPASAPAPAASTPAPSVVSSAPAPVAVAAPSAPSAADIPRPPPTSSTKPGDVAPEDQGGDVASVDVLPAHKKATVLTTKAIAKLREGDSTGAAPLLVRAVLIDPTYADAWRHLGIARAQLGDKEGARRAYKKYLALAPGAPDAAQVRQILAN